MIFRMVPVLLLATMLSGCTHIPNIKPVAADNPANPQAPCGPLFPATDFLNVSHAAAQIALPTITAGRNVPVSGSAVRNQSSGSSQSMQGMSGMPPMPGMASMPGMKMGGMPAKTAPTPHKPSAAHAAEGGGAK